MTHNYFHYTTYTDGTTYWRWTGMDEQTKVEYKLKKDAERAWEASKDAGINTTRSW